MVKVVKIVDEDGEPLSDEDLYIFLRGIADEEWESIEIDESENLYAMRVEGMEIRYRELGG